MDGTTGTAFAALDGTKINTSYSFAAAIAENNPLRKVYLVRVGLLVPPNGIAQWKAGASSPDQYANCKNNVEAALTLLGRSKISHMLWWQGEGDIATPTTYQTDFETVQTRFRGETWYPRELPVTICGLMPEVLGGTSGKDVMNTSSSSARRLSRRHASSFIPAGLPPLCGKTRHTLQALAVGRSVELSPTTSLGGPGRNQPQGC
ncbi:sialate O-acetylesterase [Mesorhizobium sp. B1-1-5]|nr:sialate O-acetylesterase [Mesorhizobium sp. B1-1-5]